MSKTTKPLLEDKLVIWKRAYEFVLEELLHGYPFDPTATILADLRAAAARTAAILIQGVELGDSSPT